MGKRITIGVFSAALCVALLSGAVAMTQEEVFRADFEWGDTGDWSMAKPARCDVI